MFAKISGEEQIDVLCANLKKSLMAAIANGDVIVIKEKYFHREVFRPEYGSAPVDLLYSGARFTIEIGEPAVRSCQR